MSRILYTAEAHVTGGRTEGHGCTSDGALEVELGPPSEMGGQGGGTNPEHSSSRSGSPPASRAPLASRRVGPDRKPVTSRSTPK
jgi:hypothetical protein